MATEFRNYIFNVSKMVNLNITTHMDLDNILEQVLHRMLSPDTDINFDTLEDNPTLLTWCIENQKTLKDISTTSETPSVVFRAEKFLMAKENSEEKNKPLLMKLLAFT
jgi:hypothetical protein